MGKDIDTMTSQEIIEYLKQTHHHSVGQYASSIDLANIFFEKGIFAGCPKCSGAKIVVHGKTSSGNIRYKCKLCGNTFTLTKNTVFDKMNITWDEMVKTVYYVITYQSIAFITKNINAIKASEADTWLLVIKILYILSSFPQPDLNGVIQIDEKYFRENQKGESSLVSFLDTSKKRHARRHNYRSTCGIFGPEFVNVLCAVDSFGHHYAKCVCLGPMTEKELKDLENHIHDVSYICTDNLELYQEWTKKNDWKHYVEPSSYRKERKARGYTNTDDMYSQLSLEEKKKNRKINEELYKAGLYPHINNVDKKSSLDELIALRYKFGLTINSVNSFHSQLEKTIIKLKTGVASNYLPLYVGAYTYLANYKKDNHITTFSLIDAENILVEMCKFTLIHKNVPTIKQIQELNILELPKPSRKVINKSKEKLLKARKIIVYSKETNDKSAYEGDTDAQFIFNKRKFFSSLGTVRINELLKQRGLYKRNMHKKEKIDKLSTLPDADDIIFYEIYLHKYGTIEEFKKAMNAETPKRKVGRPRKNTS